jgi:hypothetical protein
MKMDDPRPDLTNDTELWITFLMIALIVDEQLAYILHGFRCAGARLIKANAGYVLRPEFNKDSLWDNQGEYDRDKKQYLMVYGNKIIDCLNRLGGKV